MLGVVAERQTEETDSQGRLDGKVAQAMVDVHIRPAFMVDADARLVRWNKAGTALLGTSATVSREGKLRFMEKEVHEPFVKLLRRFFHDGGGRTVRWIVNPSLALCLRTLKDDCVTPPVYGMLTLRFTSQDFGICADSLAELAGLTPTQAKLVYALLCGEKLATFARKAGMEKNTARWHLNMILPMPLRAQ